MLDYKRQQKLNDMLQLSEQYQVREIIKFLWTETESKFCTKICSKQGYFDVKITPNSHSIFMFSPIAQGEVELAINPLSLSQITKKTEQNCLSFINHLAPLLNSKSYLKPKYREWHYYRIKTLDQAAIFIEKICNLLY